ncbi:Cation/H(+) antiporter 18 [Hibiscus syriacus]|uniref:Cation/H(+) antiporter 18 n=1 Tax=Hibiscus syriacus TaxID=106335 RepID=A0A6A2XYZ9_HIBSY|nr:Cation/H(+) antiporter 18 [Hibiscus syriacus]
MLHSLLEESKPLSQCIGPRTWAKASLPGLKMLAGPPPLDPHAQSAHQIVGTVVVSLSCRVPLRKTIALGFLMNTKGLVELIVLNIGRDRKVLNDQTYAIMVLMSLFTTFITTPVVMAVYKPARRKRDYKYRTIERKSAYTQLRILACFHNTRNIPSMINIFEASRGVAKREGLSVYALHLMELSERSSAILMAFQQSSQVTVRSMTSISSMVNMHEDICLTTEDKRVAIIILPFHKHQRADNSFETTRSYFRWMNRRVLEHVPCSVGILVDRGLGGTTYVSASNISFLITVLFFGGSNDCEVLAYGVRMDEHPGISLNIIRFVVELETIGEISTIDMQENNCIKTTSPTEEFLSQFGNIPKDKSVRYEEKAIQNVTEIINAIREAGHCNLFLARRMPDGELALALWRKSECPELGPVGSLLISPDFSATASVLVIQQYNGYVPPYLGQDMEDESDGIDS